MINAQLLLALVVMLPCRLVGQDFLRMERFDQDPSWEAVNARPGKISRRTVSQNFGFSATTAHAGGQRGEIGGMITPAAEPTYYGKRLKPLSLNDTLTASGKVMCQGKQFHVLLGFFNADTLNEWRTPNSIVIRLQGRGDKFFAYVEYATSQWRAGGDSPGGFATERDPTTGRAQLKGFPLQSVLEWSLRYDPQGNQGNGSIMVTLGKETSICHLTAGHRADGAVFNRFGIMNVMKSADTGGEVWLDDMTIQGEREEFANDPAWEGKGNRHTYESANIRPQFDFGYSSTHHAGGIKPGEMGGLLFRGDCREKHRLAAYGDRLDIIGWDQPFFASGKVALRRAVTDSTVLLGFYHAGQSLKVNPSQASGIPRSFAGIAIEGPSREGFLFYPMYRMNGDEQGYAKGIVQPRINPDGKSHTWSLNYMPDLPTGRGKLTVKLDQASVSIEVPLTRQALGTLFDRFGLVTTWIDGNGQEVYFDDLIYTHRQKR